MFCYGFCAFGFEFGLWDFCFGYFDVCGRCCGRVKYSPGNSLDPGTLDMNSSGISLPTVSSLRKPRVSQCGSPRAPSKDTSVVSSVNGARVFGLHAPGSPVRSLDLLESVTILNEDHLKPCFTDMPAMCD